MKLKHNVKSVGYWKKKLEKVDVSNNESVKQYMNFLQSLQSRQQYRANISNFNPKKVPFQIKGKDLTLEQIKSNELYK